jgi:hypothetical protein
MKKLATKNSRRVEELIASRTQRLVEELSRGRDRELAKLGKRGPDRIVSLAKWMHASFGRAGLLWITSARDVRFFERLRKNLAAENIGGLEC